MHAQAKDLVLGLIGTLCCVWVVLCWPGLDPEISMWFYSQGIGFPADRWWPVQLAYHGAPWLSRGLFVMCMVVLFVALWNPERVSRRWWRPALAWVLVVLVGVGLVVHVALKNQMGRPRPVNVQLFGGSAPYIPALQVSDYCLRNCSFVSGHAAGGFSLMALGMLACRRRRRQWLVMGIAAGGLIGLVRMAQGDHYLSDVVFAGLAIWWTQQLIRWSWLRTKCWQMRKYSRHTLSV